MEDEAFRPIPRARIADLDGRLAPRSPISVPPVELLFLRPPWWKEVEMIRLFQGVN